MSIKPDSWIRKMALENGMISPFVDGQVKNAENGKVSELWCFKLRLRLTCCQ
jgi:hypothetical protein